MTGTPDAVTAQSDSSRRREAGRFGLATVALLAVAGVVVGAFMVRPAALAEPTIAAPPGATAEVKRGTIAAQTQVSGTLGFGGEVDVIAQQSGTLTAVPQVGTVIDPGEVLYRVDGAPVILLRGATPAWRAFTWGTTGEDVRQLNGALVKLGYADGLNLKSSSDTVTWRTQRAIRNLQSAFGLRRSGVLDLGQIVFLPGSVRVAALAASLGALIGPGETVIEGTGTTAQVSAEVPVAVAVGIVAGDKVAVMLPDQSRTAGTVDTVGTIATKPAEGGAATLPVTVSLTDPDSVAALDQAPVSVAITTATAEDVLVVPVTALLAQAGSGYAVEVADDGGTHIVVVELGLFDSSSGMVEVTGAELSAGQRVVVPAT